MQLLLLLLALYIGISMNEDLYLRQITRVILFVCMCICKSKVIPEKLKGLASKNVLEIEMLTNLVDLDE